MFFYMIVGTIQEVKDNEFRVGLTPSHVQKLVADGHSVVVQIGAGEGAGFSDLLYQHHGATMVRLARDVLRKCDLLVKIKEPVPSEYGLYKHFTDKILFTFLHLAGAPSSLTAMLLKNKITAIGYETVQNDDGMLPLLMPMSEVAGVLSIQYGAQYLQKKYGGRGVSLGDITQAQNASVVIVGGGVVGTSAGLTAGRMGCNVTLFEKDHSRLNQLKKKFSGMRNVSVLKSTRSGVGKAVSSADLVIGAVLVAGKKAPLVVTQSMVESMQRGAVIVDVAIDQGGCVYGSKATSHSHPVFKRFKVLYCCIPNMPGQVALQATEALTNATFPYVRLLANNKLWAMQKEVSLLRGLQTYQGHLTHKGVAEALGMMSKYHGFVDSE